MKIILDENMSRVLAPHPIISAQQAGFAGMKNGRLLTAIEGVYDVFLTTDKTCATSRTSLAADWPLSNCPATAGRTYVGLR